LPGANTLAYYEQSCITDVKSFITLASDFRQNHRRIRRSKKFYLFSIQNY
jgi:hypothetical protein